MKKDISDKVLKNLNRVEGQIRGIAKMVEADRYCIDVVTQIEAARAALARIESDLLRQHLGHCVHRAMNSKNTAEQERVIEELVGVFQFLRQVDIHDVVEAPLRQRLLLGADPHGEELLHGLDPDLVGLEERVVLEGVLRALDVDVLQRMRG